MLEESIDTIVDNTDGICWYLYELIVIQKIANNLKALQLSLLMETMGKDDELVRKILNGEDFIDAA